MPLKLANSGRLLHDPWHDTWLVSTTRGLSSSLVRLVIGYAKAYILLNLVYETHETDIFGIYLCM